MFVAPAADPPSQPVIAGRFVLERLLGAGNMGDVFLALDRETGQRVALKVLKPADAPPEIDRFIREAQLLTELRHPNIVAHVAHGVDVARGPYLAMELLEGEDLRQHLCRGRLSVGDTVALLHGVAAALAEVHRFGVVHRDLKPSNLFLRHGEPRNVVLLDFGIARRALRGGALTRTGAIVGTPEYMAPEQARGARGIGPPTDVFALGCVIHECLTGQPVFHGEHIAAVLVKILFEGPAPLERADVPDALAELLHRMLAKDP
ncbi:MAG TPA: serine/threonine-protein kinase, partial [Nannocystis sp.]